MNSPRVSVICLCFNHEHFVREAIYSVLTQTYKNIQLIVVDDASRDKSPEIIEHIARQHGHIQTVMLGNNLGNCKAFNRGLALATGDFIIDFATDDVMMPDRIEKQINFFNTLPPDYGVVFTDATYVDAQGKFIRNHYEHLYRKGLLSTVPQGDVFRHVISQYFIASPTMMIRRKVMDALNGYDEALSYEDFDLWVRSSRNFYYAFLNERLTKIRKSTTSMSSGWYKRGDKQLHSTYLVCKKILKLSQSEDDRDALITRVRYEVKQSFFSGNFNEAKLFYGLLHELTHPSVADRIIMFMTTLKLPVSFVRRIYYWIRFRES